MSAFERSQHRFESDFQRVLRRLRKERARTEAQSHLDHVRATEGEEYVGFYSAALHGLTAGKDCRVTAMRTAGPVKTRKDAEIERVFGPKLDGGVND